MKGKGRIKVRKVTKVTTDEQLIVQGANLIHFFNVGNSRLIIDDTIVVEPGGDYQEADQTGIGIDHSYDIRFQAVTSPPTADIPKVYAMNIVKIRIHERA